MDVTAEKNAVEQLDHIDATTLAKASDITQLVEQDTVPWYRKKNLRHLYLSLVPAALGVEMTSGMTEVCSMVSKQSNSGSTVSYCRFLM